MEFCSFAELPSTDFIKFPQFNDTNCNLEQLPVYRDHHLYNNNNYAYRTWGNEKDEDLISHTRKAIILQKKYHAYRRIWNCNKFASQCDRIKRSAFPQEDTITVSSKYWPPPIVPVRGGLKIPVEYVKDASVDPWPNCLTPGIIEGASGDYAELAGEDDLTDFYQIYRIKAQPRDEVRTEDEDLTRESCQRGILNTHESEQFSVHPPSVLFMGPKIGKSHEVIVKVRNKGMTPRRMAVINPQNPCFDVIWGAGVGQNTLIAPGLTNKIVAKFNPPSSGRAVNDIITIIIDEDGAIVVPVIAQSSSKPILQMEEWNMGCSTIGNSRISNFEIINRGGDGRFWILSEEEFINEYLELRGPSIKMPARPKGVEFDGEHDESYEEERKYRRIAREKMLKKADHLVVEPFKLYPSCFHLQKNQQIRVQASYTPTKAQFDMRKLAILCDNGEVRHILVRGIGIDPKKNPLVSIEEKWTAPYPIDLPTDLNTRLTIDCGDLLTGEKKSECFKLKNDSCIPLYFFWSIRKIHLFGGPIVTSSSEGDKESSQSLKFQEEGLRSAHWRDYEDQLNNEVDDSHRHIPLKIWPAHGILKSHQSVECTIQVEGLLKEGYHTSILSIFVQQLDEQSEKILTPLIQLDNDIPIPYELLTQTLPPRKKELGRKKIKNEKSEGTAKKSPEKRSLTNSSPITSAQEQTKNVSTTKRSCADGSKNDSQSTKLPKFVFPPMPLFYIKKTLEQKDDGTQHCDITLTQLECTRTSSATHNEEEHEEKFQDYFGKVCRYSGQSQDEVKSGYAEETLWSPETEENENEDELTFKIENERLGEEEEMDLTEIDLDLERHNKKLKLLRQLAIEGCVLQHRFNDAKKWLDDSSFLQPVEEIEVWAQTVPLQCYFDPPQVTAFGQHSHKVLRTVEFVNRTAHRVQLCMDPLVISVGTIMCRPFEVTVEPFQSTPLHLTFDFRRYGDHTGKIEGSIKLPFTTVSCWLPFRIIAEGPSIQVLSPIVNFGLVLQGTEHVKTIPLRNTGTLRTKWKVSIPEESLSDEGHRHLALTSSTINKLSLVRPWPSSGTIDPGDTNGIQIYLSAQCPTKLSCSCEIIFDDDPSTVVHITILGDVQCPLVILDKCRLLLSDVFINVPNFSAQAILKNLSSFSTPFKWLEEPLGKQKSLCTIKVSPQSGVLPAKGSLHCQIEFVTPYSFLIDNLFLLCCIGGMKDPRVVKLEGAAFSITLKIVIPKTKLYRIREEDLSLDCRAIWTSQICGVDEAEGENEPGTRESFFVDYLGAYGKFCLVKQYETQAPPPSVAGLNGLEEEEEHPVELEDVEEEEEEDEDEREEMNEADAKALKGSTSKKRKTKNKKSTSKTKSNKKGKQKIKSPDSTEVDKKPKKKKRTKEKMKEKTITTPPTQEVQQEEGEEKEDVEEQEEETIQLSIGGKGENPFKDMMPEDFNPELMTSEGKLIYFQIRQHGEVSIVKFHVYNEAPVSTTFTLKVLQHPVVEPEEVKVEEGQQFVKLDEDFFNHFRTFHDKESRRKDMLNGKAGGIFHADPCQGILEAFRSVEITIEFHANTPGIYEDQLECHFEGLDKPYIIKLEALATMCDKRCQPDETTKAAVGETIEPICERRLNPLLY